MALALIGTMEADGSTIFDNVSASAGGPCGTTGGVSSLIQASLIHASALDHALASVRALDATWQSIHISA